MSALHPQAIVNGAGTESVTLKDFALIVPPSSRPLVKPLVVHIVDMALVSPIHQNVLLAVPSPLQLNAKHQRMAAIGVEMAYAQLMELAQPALL